MNLVKQLAALLVLGVTVVSAMDDGTEAGREAIKRAEEARYRNIERDAIYIGEVNQYKRMDENDPNSPYVQCGKVFRVLSHKDHNLNFLDNNPLISEYFIFKTFLENTSIRAYNLEARSLIKERIYEYLRLRESLKHK